MTNYEETIQALTTCRDHWKTSFEHERANVIRLQRLLARAHEDQLRRYRSPGECICEDCQIVRQHNSEPQPPKP